MEQERYTIEDLQELTGYSRRTIRYYIQEGLLEPPAGRGRGGFYFDSHLRRLLEIKSYQDKGLKLADITEVIREGGDVQPVPYLREVWIKFPVKPGVEIHVSRDLEEKERKKVDEIIRIAKSILTKGGEENE